jgi:hypothetical protein
MKPLVVLLTTLSAIFFTNVADAARIPLAQFWNGGRADNFLDATNDAATVAREIGYDLVRIEGYGSTTPGAGLKPLTLLWNNRNDNFSTGTASRITHAVGAGYTNVRVQCYIWINPAPGLVPLKLFWNAARTDNYTTASAGGEADALAAGYIFSGIEGYIQPAFVTIPVATWRNALNNVFTNSSVRLNNYTPVQNQYDRNERQFYRPNDSYLRLVFNGTPIQYPIPIDVIQTGPDRMYKMYVNDWNTRNIIARNEGNRIKISLLFESDGTEIIGNCYNNFWCGSSPAPNFNYSDAVIDIYLDLRAERGQISYNATNRFTATVAESGPCVNNFFAMFCPADRSSLIKTTIENKLNEHLNSDTVRSLMGALFAQLLPSGTPVRRVTMIATGDIVVE